VGLTRSLYERFRILIHEVAKFGVVGGIAFLVTAGGTNLLHFQMNVGPITSNVIATILATALSYVGNRYWTFRHRMGMSSVAGEYTLFFVLNAIGLLIQLASIGFTYYALGLHDKLSYNVALLIGIILGTLFRFWSYRKWVWRAHPAGPEAVASDHQPGASPAPAPGHQPLVSPSPAATGFAEAGPLTSSPLNGMAGNDASPAPYPGADARPLPGQQTQDMAGPGAPHGRW
jgi:putative flippase GtrA